MSIPSSSIIFQHLAFHGLVLVISAEFLVTKVAAALSSEPASELLRFCSVDAPEKRLSTVGGLNIPWSVDM